MEIMEVPPAREGSWDNLLHFIDNDCIDNNGKNKLVIFSKDIDNIQKISCIIRNNLYLWV